MSGMLEPLESRRMFTVSAVLVGSSVMVQGDGAANIISVIRSGPNLLVRSQQDGLIFPVTVTLLSVPASSVNRIVPAAARATTAAAESADCGRGGDRTGNLTSFPLHGRHGHVLG